MAFCSSFRPAPDRYPGQEPESSRTGLRAGLPPCRRRGCRRYSPGSEPAPDYDPGSRVTVAFPRISQNL